MHDTVQWIAVFGMIVIASLFALEVRKWRSIGRVMTRGQRILRVLLMLCVEALFVMMIIGPSVTSHKDPIGSLLYWTVCLILCLGVVVLAMLDLKAVAAQYARLSREMFQELKRDDRREK
jgi:hypothetical protein